MADDIQEWALKKAYDLRNEGFARGDCTMTTILAAYIQQHENPPVDPVKTIAKALAEKWAPDMVTPLPSARETSLEAMAEEALRRGIELASQQGDG